MVIAPSAKEQIVLAAERLFAERGLDGASLRQIGAESGNRNNSAVRYHFGSKERLIQAIFAYRLPQLYQRRQKLIAERRPDDLRSWVECYVLPTLELGEREDSHYLTFVNMLRQHGRRDVFEHLSKEFHASTQAFVEHVGVLLPNVPEPLRTHRIHQVLSLSVHSASDRERDRAHGERVLPFVVYVNDLLDGLVGFVSAPVSRAAMAALDATDPASLTRPALL